MSREAGDPGVLGAPVTREESVQGCCTAVYGSDVVALLLGESYHPGGPALTRRLLDRLGLRAGGRALDVASGPGTTALAVARAHDVTVDGVDLVAASVEKATAAAREAGLEARVRFTPGDATRLPYEDGVFDAVVCECAFCTFTSKSTAAAEIARVLRPGGRLGLTDVTVRPGALTGELTSLPAWVACVADARPADAYADLLTDAGLVVERVEHHDEAALRMVEQIDARLRALRMVAADTPALAGVDVDRVLAVVGLAAEAVRAGDLGYALLVARRP